MVLPGCFLSKLAVASKFLLERASILSLLWAKRMGSLKVTLMTLPVRVAVPKVLSSSACVEALFSAAAWAAKAFLSARAALAFWALAGAFLAFLAQVQAPFWAALHGAVWAQRQAGVEIEFPYPQNSL